MKFFIIDSIPWVWSEWWWVIRIPFKDKLLEQNYRNFDFESPWEGTQYIKNIDKKIKNDKKN